MKKTIIITIVGAFVLALGLTSCKKDYTCECTVRDSAGAVVTTMSTSVTLHTTKKKAKDACTVTMTTPGFTQTCSIQ